MRRFDAEFISSTRGMHGGGNADDECNPRHRVEVFGSRLTLPDAQTASATRSCAPRSSAPIRGARGPRQGRW